MASATDSCLKMSNNPDNKYSENDAIQYEYRDANSTIQTNQDHEHIMVSNNGLSAYKPTEKPNLKATSLEDTPKLPSEEDQAIEKSSEKPQVMYVQKFNIILVNSPNSLKRNLKRKFKTMEESPGSYEVGTDINNLNGLNKSQSTEIIQSQQNYKKIGSSRQGRGHSVEELKQFFEKQDIANLHKKNANTIYSGYAHKPSLKEIKQESMSSGKYQQIKQSFEDPTFTFSPQSINNRARSNGNAGKRESFEELEEADAILIEEMSLALEKGDIVAVAKIVENNPHLVNVVPPKIGLGPLHQAAVKGEVNIVNKLLYYPASNPYIKTTEAENNIYGAGKTADELTNREDIRTAIKTKKHELSKEYDKCPTLVDISDSNLILMDYTAPSIEKNRGTICSEQFKSDSFEVFTKMMEDVFLYAHYTSNWKEVRAKACAELIRFDNQIADHVKNLESRESFYNNLLELYTSGKLLVFKNVNEELRNQAARNYKSLIRLSLYAAIVSSILFVWEDLQPYTKATYRGMNIEKEETDKYLVGTEFAWLNFVSSSSDQKVAKRFGNSLFIFDNKTLCKWSPKSMENISQFKREKEYLYPCGAQFRVTEVETVENKTHIYLKLICTVDPSPARSLFDETVENIKNEIKTVDEKVKQFGNNLNELKETVQTANGNQNNENNQVGKEDEKKAKIEEFLSAMEDDRSDIDGLIKGIKQNIKLLKYGLTGGESIGKNILNKLFRNKNNDKQRDQIQHLNENVRPIKKLMKKHKISFNETSEFAKLNVL